MSENSKCRIFPIFLYGTVKYMQFGIVQNKQGEKWPALYLFYDRGSLVESLCKVITEMAEKNARPKVYIFKESEQKSDIFVLFKLKSPSLELIQSLADQPLSFGSAQGMLIAGAEADIDTAAAEIFLNLVGERRSFQLIIAQDDTQPFHVRYSVVLERIETSRPPSGEALLFE